MIARTANVARTAILTLLATAGGASAQVVFEPVRIQYGDAQPYYYAGDNPQVHAGAAFPSAPGAIWGRVGGFAFVGDRRQVVQRDVRTFTDAFGTLDARPFGLTPDQVQNEANARLPRYFTKAAIVAERRPDGTVAPTAGAPERPRPRGTIEIRPWGRPPLYGRNPVLVIPKSSLDKRIADVALPKRV